MRKSLYMLYPLWESAVQSTAGKGSDKRMFSTMNTIRSLFGGKNTLRPFFFHHIHDQGHL